MLTPTRKEKLLFIVACTMVFCAFLSQAWSQQMDHYEYKLYRNSDNHGIVIFPKKRIFSELDEFLLSLNFTPVESGVAVMRYGPKEENATYMMPAEVQKKHSIDKFIVLQILTDEKSIMVGVYEQEFGLTLPSKVFQFNDIKNNIPKTLDIFRGQSGSKKNISTETSPGNTATTYFL